VQARPARNPTAWLRVSLCERRLSIAPRPKQREPTTGPIFVSARFSSALAEIKSPAYKPICARSPASAKPHQTCTAGANPHSLLSPLLFSEGAELAGPLAALVGPSGPITGPPATCAWRLSSHNSSDLRTSIRSHRVFSMHHWHPPHRQYFPLGVGRAPPRLRQSSASPTLWMFVQCVAARA
jgi:hypothetical protein